MPLSRSRKPKKQQTQPTKSRTLQGRSAAYWAALGTLTAYSVFSGERAVLAGTVTDTLSDGSQAQAQLPVRRFNIPAGPLDGVLRAYHDATGLLVVTQLSADTIANFSSNGVSGFFTNEQAMREILAGTSLSYNFSRTGSVTVGINSSELLEVRGQAPTAMAQALPKYTSPIRDTPQSIDTVPREIMEQQGSTTLRDVLRNIAGISIAAGEGGAQGDNLTIRGFTARNDIFVDGMRDFGSYYRDPFNLEEVEVLKGPSSVTFGRGSTGGVVNQATKSATLTPAIGSSIDFGSDKTRRATVDLNEPLPQLGEGTALRINVMGHDSQVAERDIAENRRFGFAGSLVSGLGTATRMSLSYVHQTANDTPDYGIPWLFDSPAPVDRENYYGFKDANFLKTDVDISTAKIEHDFSDTLSLRNQVRYANYNREVQITEAKTLTTITPATPLANINVTRNQIAVNSTESFLQDQADAIAVFHHGNVKQTVVAGFEVGRETSDPTRFAFTNVPTTSLLHPDENQPFAGTATVSSKVETTAVNLGAYVIDTIAFSPKWEVTGGVRLDHFDTDYRSEIGTIAKFSRVDTMPNFRGAIVYKPRGNGSVYADFSTSSNPSAEALSLSASTADLSPEKNRNIEVGTKWDISHDRLSLRAAIFRTEKLNAREPDPNNPLLNVLAGDQRVDGVELEATGHVNDRMTVLTSYAHLDSELVKSVYYKSAVGARLANVPANTFSLWTNYEFPERLAIGIGGQYVGRRTASSTAPLDPSTGILKQAPGYTVFNAMASHPLSPSVGLQLNIYNLANKYYFDQLHPGHIVPGAGRSALLSINFRPSLRMGH